MSQQIYMNYIHPSSLLKQLSVLWRTDQLCDAVITVDKVIIAKAHKLVLFAISPKLKRGQGSSQQSSILEVDLPSGISSTSAEAFLQYMYEGFLVLTEPLVRDLSRIAKHLDIQCLIKCCNDYQSKLDAGTLHSVDTDFDDEAVNSSTDFPHVRRYCVKNKNSEIVNSTSGPQAKRSRIMTPNIDYKKSQKETLDVRKKQPAGDWQSNSTSISEGNVKQNAFPQFIVQSAPQRTQSDKSGQEWNVETADVDQDSNDNSFCKREALERPTCSYDSNTRQPQQKSSPHTVFAHSSTPLTHGTNKNLEGNESSLARMVKTEPEEVDDDCEISGVSVSDTSFPFIQTDTHPSDYTQSDLDQSDRGDQIMRFDFTAASASDLNESYIDEQSMNISDAGHEANMQPGSSRTMNETMKEESLDAEMFVKAIMPTGCDSQVLSFPYGTGDSSGAILYGRRSDPLNFEEVYNILKNPDHEKVINTAPCRPAAGSLYLFSSSGDARRVNEWKLDQYFWLHNGRKLKKERDEQIAKIYHKTKTGPESGSLKFNRHAYHFVSNPSLVLVHYIGDEKVYVPYVSLHKSQYPRYRTPNT